MKVGMNATETEFSAKSLLNRFGIMNAIPNASESAEVPRKRALVISLINPRIRERRVNAERESPFAKSELFLFILNRIYFIVEKIK